jgi:acyl-CoA thioester hydrolase
MAPALLDDYPVHFECPVSWGEMDAFEHVNNVMYFRYFESARLAYFERIGYVQWMKDHGVGPILASTSCRFRRPLTYPDTIIVGARVTNIGDDRFTMGYRIYSTKLNDIAAEGEGLVVNYDYTNNCKASLPETIRRSIETT